MDLVPSDKEQGLPTPIWNHYESLLPKADSQKPLMKIERFEFKNVKKKKKGICSCCKREDGTLWQHHPQEGTSSPRILIETTLG